MSTIDSPIPETRVLAIASHFMGEFREWASLHRGLKSASYVGNTMAGFVMQSLGCDVAAINTVQFSNHTGYGQWQGTRATASEITALWQGLKNSYLDDFDMMLSGYVPGAAAVEAVGSIARELKLKAILKPGSFFWVLDPVMGDNGKLYVADDVVPAYKALMHDADLILPNQYEAEWLSGVKITDMRTLTEAITVLHSTYRVPHVVISSVSFVAPGAVPPLFVLGSTMNSTSKPRIFRIQVPALDCFFSGTGDMFAALMLVRLREAVSNIPGLGQKDSWVSDDDIAPCELPLAKAVEKALASMQEVLTRTKEKRDEEIARLEGTMGRQDPELHDAKKSFYLKATRAAEVRIVRNLDCVRNPVLKYHAEKVAY